MRRVLPFAFLAVFFLVGAGQAQAQVDISGTWEITWDGPRGSSTTTFTFQQDGNTFSGTAAMQGRGAPPGGAAGGGGARPGGAGPREVEISDGTIDGNTITFTMATGMGQRSMSFAFSGTVEGDSMEGIMTNPRGESPFTGVKK